MLRKYSPVNILKNTIMRNVTYLTFDKPCKFVDFKNRIQLCLNINKRQRKFHVICMGGMPEGRVTTRCVGLLKINFLRSLQSQEVSSEQLVAMSTGPAGC